MDLQEEKMAVIGNALDETASRGIGRLSTKDLGRLFVSLHSCLAQVRSIGDEVLIVGFLFCRVTVKLKCGEWEFGADQRVTSAWNPY